MVDAELRQSTDRDAILLAEPGEFQPVLALLDQRRRVSAGDEHAQRNVALGREFLHRLLQKAELQPHPAR